MHGLREKESEKNFEQLWVYAKFLHSPLSLLKLLQKVSRTGDKNLLIPTFLTNLALEQKYGDPGTKYLNTTGPDTFGGNPKTRIPLHSLSEKILITSPPTAFLKYGQPDFSKASDKFG